MHPISVDPHLSPLPFEAIGILLDPFSTVDNAKDPQACHNGDPSSIYVIWIALASVHLIRLPNLTYLSSTGTRFTVFPKLSPWTLL